MKRMKMKTILALAMIAVVLTAAIGGTLAYLIAKTDAVVNTFQPGSVPIEIEEKFDNNVKSDIKIKNNKDSDTSVYVRVNLLCYWSDAEGNPAGRNAWSLPDVNLGEGWITDGEYYYYADLIKPGDGTSALFSDSIILESVTDAKDTFYQTLDILAQAVQAIPADAVEEAWPNVDVSEGKLVLADSGN